MRWSGGCSKEVAFGLKRWDGENWRKSILDVRNSICKGPEAGLERLHLKLDECGSMSPRAT